MTERAYAKVNLSLDAIGRRTDGFHDLRSVMQTVSLHDSLTLTTGEIVDQTPSGSDFSLIDRAIAAVREQVGSSVPIPYRLEKRIPIGAGLGGGSTDAVAAVRGACRLLAVKLDPQSMLSLAASLGSDVPFFLYGGTALVTGRGERVEPLPALPSSWFLLMGTGTHVSTGAVFDELRPDEYSHGEGTDEVLEGLSAGRLTLGKNSLTSAAIRAFPEIEASFALLAEVAPMERIRLCGSGGTVMAAFSDGRQARAAYRSVEGRAPWSCLARSVHVEHSFSHQ